MTLLEAHLLLFYRFKYLQQIFPLDASKTDGQVGFGPRITK